MITRSQRHLGHLVSRLPYKPQQRRRIRYCSVSLMTCVCLWLGGHHQKLLYSQSPSAPQPAQAPTPNAATSDSSSTAGAGTVKSGQVELANSHVYIHVYKSKIGHEHAIIGNLQSGDMRLAAADNPQVEPGTLVFDMNSFDADTAAARRYIGIPDSIDENTRKQVNQNMLGKEVLDVRSFPTARLAIKKITRLSGQSERGLPQMTIDGDFTLHGVTKPIRFNVDVEEVKGWQRVRGAFAIQQTQFGIKPYSKMFGTIGVADKLDIYGDLFVAP